MPQAALAAARDSLRLKLPLATASSSLAPTAAPAFIYVVRRGDTLHGIAWRLYGRAALAGRLQAENNIAEPKRLQIGQRLRVFTL